MTTFNNWGTGTTNSGTTFFLNNNFFLQSYVDLDAPLLSHQGPTEFSTCTDLAIRPEVCWDVNRYYQILGVHWKATKKQLMRGYQKFGSMPSALVTYCFTQLLDPEVRTSYDAAPLGMIFNDKYVQQWLMRKAKMEMSKFGMNTEDPETLRQAFAAMGINVDFEPDQTQTDTTEEVVDEDLQDVQDEVSATESTQAPWAYAYYLWRSNSQDTERLREWQELLVQAFREKGIKTRLAVGFHGRSAHPWLTSRIGYRTVVFLNDAQQPTVEAARSAADRVVQDAA